MLSTVLQGSRGPEVVVLQAQLNLGIPGKTPLALDGIFGPLTLGRVLEFQRSRTLVTDGIVGPKTWAKLSSVRRDSDATEPALPCDNGNPANQGRCALLGQALRDTAGRNAPLVTTLSFAGPTSVGAKAISVAGVTLVPLIGSPHEPTARGVYSASLHYDRIFLSNAKGLEGRAFTAPVPVPPLMVSSLPFGGTIQVLNIGTSPGRDTLIHELGHAWQSQHHPQGSAYASNCIACQGAALAANKLIAEVDPSVRSHSRWPVNFPMSAYAYRPGRTFAAYGGEQIAQQIENGETSIVTHVTGAAAGTKDAENQKSVALENIRVEDLRASGVKM